MSGYEAITKRLMDTIVIGKHAEAAYRRRLIRQAASTKYDPAPPEQATAGDLA